MITFIWYLTSETFGIKELLHLRIMSNLAANRICIVIVLNLCGNDSSPILRIARDGVGLVIITVIPEIRENILL